MPADWDDAKIKAANFSSRALNALFTNEEFKKISSTKTAKKAWTILQTTYEGTKVVKDLKLQRLTTSFKGSLLASKRLRWRRMSHLMNSMPSSRI